MTVTYDEMVEMLREAISHFKELGYVVGKITDLDVSHRYTRAWAKCFQHKYKYVKTFRITVSDRLFKANKKSVSDIIHHEVIHTIPGCFNHGPKFKKAAAICNKKFGTQINIYDSEAAVYYGKGIKQVKNYTKYQMSL